MIKISRLNKKYNDVNVLKNINLTFPDKGLIAIMGPSGCGKSTLLKCISGLVNYEGSIIFNKMNLSLLSPDKMSRLRLKEYGFVFQNFSLFNHETIYRNIIFPLEVLSNENIRIKRRMVDDVYQMVNLNLPIHQLVCKLSGGEKQRVAIARALINNPKILLCDEPTGSLDHKNAENIMDVLNKASKKRLVIIVSHDEQLMSRYAEKIYFMKDGQIEYEKEYARVNNNKALVIANINKNKKKHTIPTLFLIKHSFLVIKEKFFRLSFVTVLTSIGLLAVGLSLSITSIVSSSIKKSYSALIDEDQIIVSDPNKEVDNNISLGSFYEASDIQNKYPDYVNSISVIYFNDFENFYTTANQFYALENGIKRAIEGLNTRSINEYRDLALSNETFYPSKPEYLNEDEIAVSLTIDNIEDICFALKITRTLSSLIEYVDSHDLYFVLETANDKWEYDDQQIFKVKAFCLSNESCIYHYANNFNEIIFEEKMRMPISYEYNMPLEKPYILRKGYCLNVKDKEKFLKLAYEDDFLSNFLYENAKDYYQNLYNDISYKECQRLIFFNNPNKSTLSINKNQYFYKSCQEITNPIYGSKKGIIIYPDSLLMGFANNMFVSSNEEKLMENNEINSYLTSQESQNLITDDEVVMGAYYKVKSQGLSFESRMEYEGLDYDHIVISSSLAEKLFQKDNPVNKKIYLSYVNKTITYSSGAMNRNFINQELIVSDVIEDENYIIFHNPLWSIIYFQSRLGISCFDLMIDNISFKNNNGDKSLEKLSKDFPNYSFSSPLKDVNQSVDQVCFYMVIALFIFSILCIIIATLLIIISNYLFALENRNDIELAMIIGVSKKESGKFVSTNTYVLGFISFLFASLELIVLCLILSNSVSSMSTILISILAMFLLALFISTFTSFVVKKIALKK